jgi:hypothetical protein
MQWRRGGKGCEGGRLEQGGGLEETRWDRGIILPQGNTGPYKCNKMAQHWF